jgi:branched-chain amino acid transport system substrate-binding protein
MSTKLFSGTLLWLAALLVLFGLGGAPAEAQQAKEEIVIGYSMSLTGKFATEGSDVHRAYQMWAEDVNKEGGIPVKEAGRKLPVRLIYYDDGSDTNNAIKNYERLISKDRVDLLLSPWGSGHNFAVTPLIEKDGYPLVLSAAGSDAIFSRNFTHIFETTQLASNLYTAIVDYLSSIKDQVKTVAIAHENFLFTQALYDSVKPKLEKAGFTIVADEQYPLGGQDFTSLLTKVREAKPDAFILINIMPSSIYMTRQMNEVGLKPKFYAVNIGPMYTGEFIGKLGPLSEGVAETGFWHPDLPFEGARKFFDSFVARYKKAPSTDAAYAYVGVQVLQQGIELAGSFDHERVNTALHAGKFNTILGPFQYDAKGTTKEQTIFLAQVQNGKRVVVWPKNLATTAPRFPYQ